MPKVEETLKAGITSLIIMASARSLDEELDDVPDSPARPRSNTRERDRSRLSISFQGLRTETDSDSPGLGTPRSDNGLGRARSRSSMSSRRSSIASLAPDEGAATLLQSLARGKVGRRVSMSAKRVGVRVCARIRPPHKKEERGPIQFLSASPMKGMPSERVQIRNLEFCLDRIFDDDSQAPHRTARTAQHRRASRPRGEPGATPRLARCNLPYAVLCVMLGHHLPRVLRAVGLVGGRHSIA